MESSYGYEMHEEVIIKATGEHAFVVWFDEKGNDSFLLEKKGKEEMPHFYKTKDFMKIK